MARADSDDAAILEHALKNGQRESLGELIRILRSTDAIDASLEVAREYQTLAISALAVIPQCHERDALVALANYAVNRNN